MKETRFDFLDVHLDSKGVSWKLLFDEEIAVAARGSVAFIKREVLCAGAQPNQAHRSAAPVKVPCSSKSSDHRGSTDFCI